MRRLHADYTLKQIRAIRLLVQLLPWLCIVVNSLQAQDFLVTKWRNEDGLPHSTVNALAQTRDGYLWIGAYVGLVRFDGVRFVHYPSSKMPELESGRISALFEDRSGTLWIAMESGRLLTWQDGAVKIHFPESPQSVPIISMVEDAQGVVWCQRADGDLYRVTPTGLEFAVHCGQLPSRNAV